MGKKKTLPVHAKIVKKRTATKKKKCEPTTEIAIKVMGKKKTLPVHAKIVKKRTTTKKKKCEPTTEIAIKVMGKKKTLPVHAKIVKKKTATKKKKCEPTTEIAIKVMGKKKTLPVHAKIVKKRTATKKSVSLKQKLRHLSNVDLDQLNLSLYQCAICEKSFSSSESRQNHEFRTHLSAPKLALPSTDVTSELGNCSSYTEQQEFLIYFQLEKKISKINSMKTLASRPKLLQALQIAGNKTGSFNCHFCVYTTSRMFILWAHVFTHHNIINSEKNSGKFCFLCCKKLNKHIRYLNHVNKCITTQIKNEKIRSNSTIKFLTCYICNSKVTSNSDLEIHMWNHISTQINSN